MKKLLYTFAILPLASFLALIPAAAADQSGSFIIAQHGTSVGKANYKFVSNAGGYDSTSVVRVDMKGLKYDLSKSDQLNASDQLNHVLLSASVNGTAVSITGAPDAAQFVLNISANGQTTTTRIDSHPAAVFLPDFDPGALETLLTVAANNNNRGLWAIIPKKAGTTVPIQLATYADMEGTLDSKPITVHHLKATMAGETTDIFSGPENQLLLAQLPQEGFALVRNGFVLTPPAKPVAPPAQPPADAEPNQAAPNQ